MSGYPRSETKLAQTNAEGLTLQIALCPMVSGHQTGRHKDASEAISDPRECQTKKSERSMPFMVMAADGGSNQQLSAAVVFHAPSPTAKVRGVFQSTH